MDPLILAILAEYLSPLALRLRGLTAVQVAELQARAAVSFGPKVEAPKTQVVDGVAIIRASGVLVKTLDWGALFMGAGPASLPQIEKQINDAATDSSVKAIVLAIDSPGGTVAGTAEAADAVYRARQVKPVVAIIQDMGASGAYYLASQASKIYANRAAVVGSIGVYCVVPDFSKMAEMEGVKINIVKAGEMKGAGEAGTVVTEPQLAEMQRRINQLAETFIAAVARGRGWTTEKALAMADGRVHVGVHAQDVGLIDGIKTLDEAVAELAGRAPSMNFRQANAATATAALSAGSGQAAAQEGERLMNPRLKKYLVSVGLKADASDAQAMTFLAALTTDQKDIADALLTPATPAAAVTPAPAASAPAAVIPSPVDLSAAATLAERTRIAEIRGMVAMLGLDASFADQMVNGGFSLAEANAQALKKYAQAHQPVAIGEGRVTVGSDLNRDTLAVAIGDALCVKAGVAISETDARGDIVMASAGKAKVRPAHERSRDFSGRSLIEIGRAYLQALNVPGVGALSKDEIARCMVSSSYLRRRFGEALGVQSTSDFPSILASTVNRTLRLGYVERPPSWTVWARRATAPDYRTISRVALSEMPSLVVRKEGGEIKFVTFGDGKEVYALEDYAGGILITQRVIINDDVNFLSRLPIAEMSACRRLEDDVAYAPLTANTALADNIALFYATHNNLVGSGSSKIYYLAADPAEIDTVEVCFLEGRNGPLVTDEIDFDTSSLKIKVEHTCAAKAIDFRGLVCDKAGSITVTALGAARKLMRSQLGPKGKARLNLSPRFVLCGSDGETEMEQLTGSQFDPAKNVMAKNPFYGLTMVVDPRLG
jgi:signal peptide peptidase SppA